MNLTNIGWCDLTLNTATGCKHGCAYCYARRIASRFNGTKAWPNGFEPTFHPERLTEPGKVKKPSRIFVGSMGDLFGDWVPREWIERTLKMTQDYPWHTYIFLTKNPARYREFSWPDNCWMGTSIENQEAANERINSLLEAKALVKFLSIEPLLGPVNLTHVARLEKYPSYIDDVPDQWTFYDDALTGFRAHKAGGSYGPKADWVIIGAQTGPGAVKPEPAWVESLIKQCRDANVPLFLKDNLHWPEIIQQWPRAGDSR